MYTGTCMNCGWGINTFNEGVYYMAIDEHEKKFPTHDVRPF